MGLHEPLTNLECSGVGCRGDGASGPSEVSGVPVVRGPTVGRRGTDSDARDMLMSVDDTVAHPLMPVAGPDTIRGIGLVLSLSTHGY